MDILQQIDSEFERVDREREGFLSSLESGVPRVPGEHPYFGGKMKGWTKLPVNMEPIAGDLGKDASGPFIFTGESIYRLSGDRGSVPAQISETYRYTGDLNRLFEEYEKQEAPEGGSWEIVKDLPKVPVPEGFEGLGAEVVPEKSNDKVITLRYGENEFAVPAGNTEMAKKRIGELRYGEMYTDLILPSEKELAGKKIKMPVEVIDTGETKEMEMSALEVRKDLLKRNNILKQLIEMKDEGSE